MPSGFYGEAADIEIHTSDVGGDGRRPCCGGVIFRHDDSCASDYRDGGISDLSVEVAEEGPRWQGETPANVDAFVTNLGAYVDSHPRQLGGVALSPDSQCATYTSRRLSVKSCPLASRS